MLKFREGMLNTAQKNNYLKKLWIDFTSTTSFKSKANCLRDNTPLERDLFIYLELDITTSNMPYNYTVCL